MDEWLKVTEAAPDVWAIDDRGEDTMYLVAGKDKALLIDTGWGVGDLPDVLSKLTSLPLVVVHTHGHPDHVSGSYHFPEVLIHETDLGLIFGCFREENRQWALDNVLEGPFPAGFSPGRWVRTELQEVLDIRDGHRFDLGGRVLETILVPGHTPGSIMLIDREAKLLFSGDSLLEGDHWLHLEESTPLEIYYQSLVQLGKNLDRSYRNLPAHDGPISLMVLDEMLAGLPAILSGECRGTPCETFVGNGLCCKFNHCGVIYQENRLKR